jgi:hypothetical protein
MAFAMAMKHMIPAQQTAMNQAAELVKFLTALMMIAVQSRGLAMAMRTVKISNMGAI